MPINPNDVIIGGYPLKDENGNFIGHHTSWGEDIYFTKETRDAIQTDKVDKNEQDHEKDHEI